MPTQLGEGMTGSRTQSGPAPTYLRHHGLEKAHTTTSAASGIRRQHAAGRPSVKTVRPRYAAGAPS
jgi:hypothetical protein